MELVVYKYQFPHFADELTVTMDADGQVVHADIQNEVICIWTVVNTTPSKTANRRFIVRGTGHKLPNGNFKPLSSFSVNDGQYVFHVFEDLDFGAA